jgi:hypothetical protein
MVGITGRVNYRISHLHMCADQAKKAFADTDTSSTKDFYYTRYDYVSHYDPKANVCYIMTTSYSFMRSTGSRPLAYLVFDAFEGRVYANFIRIAQKGKADYEAKPMECSIKPHGQKEITCKDSDEFEALVEKNFGIAQ